MIIRVFIFVFLLDNVYVQDLNSNDDNGIQNQSPLQRMAQEPDLTIATQLMMSVAGDGDLSSSLLDPTFGGIICAPTDDAFEQFFDDTQTSQEDLLTSQNLIEDIAKTSVIQAGEIPGGFPQKGENFTAQTFTGPDRTFIEMNANYLGGFVATNGTTAESVKDCSMKCLNLELCNTFVYCGEEDGCNNRNLSIVPFQRCDLKFQSLVQKRELPEAWYIGPDTEFTSGFVWRGESLFVSRNEEGDVRIQSAAGSVANMTGMIKLQNKKDGMIWKIDEVLLSKSTDALIQALPLDIKMQPEDIFVEFFAPQSTTAALKKSQSAPMGIKGDPTPIDLIASQENTTVMSSILKVGVSDQMLQNSLTDPNFGGIICVPTDDAFDQFFDEQQITQDSFLSQQELVDEFVSSNVIPGNALPMDVLAAGMPATDTQITANTFAGQEGELFINRNSAGETTIYSTAGSSANMLGMVMKNDTTVWILDNVLKSEALDLLLKSTPQNIVAQETDLTVLSQVFQANTLNNETQKLLQDPTFGGIICAPTDDAFDQFFDEQQTSEQGFIQSESSLNQVIDLHIIPESGMSGGMPMPGSSVNATTLSDQQLIISRNMEGEVTVTDPSGVSSNLTQNIQRGDARLWKLDTVLQSTVTT